MCGIVGIINQANLNKQDISLLKELLVYNSVRGAHSTGLFGGCFGYAPGYAKSVGSPYDLFDAKETQPFLNGMEAYQYAIGHGRSATRGKITAKNAHPFQKKTVIGVHNGSVWHRSLVDVITHEVDSEAIISALSNNPSLEVLSDIVGAYALIWYDTKNHTLFLARNEERPLHIIITENNRFIFSGEEGFAKLACYRNGYKIKESFSIKENTLYSFNEALGFSYETTPIPTKKYKYEKTLWKETPTKIQYVKEKKQTLFVGEEVEFDVTQIVEMGKTKQGEEQLWQLFGENKNFRYVEFCFYKKGTEESLSKTKKYKGTIRTLIKVPSNNYPDKYTAYLSNLEEMK